MISSNTYEEVYEILTYMDENTVNKIPKEILNTIKKKRNVNFKTKIDKNDIFNEKNISKETIDFLCWIDYKYWMDENRKVKIDKINFEKIKKNEEEKRKKYNPDDIFKNKQKIINKDQSEKKSLTVIKKEKWYKKMFDLIKGLFGKK